MKHLVVVFVAALPALSACSSDALPEPEPTLTTRGAFVAVDEGASSLALYRTLDYLELEFSLILFVSEYRVEPVTFDEAREMSKDHAIPVRIEFDYKGVENVTLFPYQVVWFRTLTDEEEARVP